MAPNENTPLKGGGPKDLEDRGCTDIVCLGVFLGFWAILVALFSVVMVYGDPHKVTNGLDYLGNVCGYSGNTSQLSKVWYPRISQDIAEQPEAIMSGFWWQIDLYGVCVDECPTFSRTGARQVIPDYGYPYGSSIPSWEVYMNTADVLNRCIPDPEATSTSINLCVMPNCTAVGAPCSPLQGTFTIPMGAWEMTDEHPASQCGREVSFSYGTQVVQPNSNEYIDWLFQQLATASDTIDALRAQWGMLVVLGIVLSLVVNFAWLIVLYLFAFVAVWASLFLILLALLLGSIFSFVKAGSAATAQFAAIQDSVSNATDLDMDFGGLINASNSITTSIPSSLNGALSPAEGSQQTMYLASGWLCLLGFVLFAVFICCSRKSIARCVVLITEASSVLGSMKGLAILPVCVSFIQLGFTIWCAFVLLVLPTMNMAGTMQERLAQADVTSQLSVYIIGIYVIFGAIWTYEFFSALVLMTVAACTFYFYFVNKNTVPAGKSMKQYDDNQTSFPVLVHLGWVLRYHIGTLAFGSAIVAIITVIQICTKAVFEYIEQQQGSNPILLFASKCVQCCLWCFKKTVEFINSYAYIYCFVENVSFCTGAWKTFTLMLSYPAQIAINTAVQRVLSLLVTLTTPLFCACVAYSYFDFIASDADVHSGSGGLLLPGTVLALSLLMTRAFATVWEQVVQSLTVCVLHDVDNYDGHFLRENMKAAFDNPSKSSKVNPQLVQP